MDFHLGKWLGLKVDLKQQFHNGHVPQKTHALEK